MTRYYPKKCDGCSKNRDRMTDVIITVLRARPYTMSAKIHNTPEPTLRRFIRLPSEEIPTDPGKFKKVFLPEQTSVLVKYLSELDQRFFGMTETQCRRLVYEFAERNGVDHPFDKDLRMAGEDWFCNFMKEFSFNVRPAETVQSSQGTLVCSQNDIDDFFKTLYQLRKNYKFLAEKIYHADEICISAVPSDLTRFSSSNSKGKGSGRMSVEARDNVTLVCCASAIGSYIPPMIVFPRDKMIPGFLRGLPPGSIGYTSEKGLINSELFSTFLKHFVQHALPSSSSPVLLLIDNYISYISLEAMDFCADHNVVVMGFPPNSRQKLQPLDISFFGPLKACYSHACDGFSDAYPRVKLTVENVGEVFRTAYCKTATAENAIKGFEESGIEPFRSQIFNSTGSLISEDLMEEDTSQTSERVESADVSVADDSDIEIISWKEPDLDTEKTLETQEKCDSLKGTAEGNGDSIACLHCSGLYPTREWIQCPLCKQWWHRNCPAYHRGVYCDYCKESVLALMK